MSSREKENRLRGGGEIVLYVSTERVEEGTNQRRVDRHVNKNLNIFSFARSTLTTKEVVGLCAKYRIDLNTYKLSVIPPPTLTTTTYTPLSVSHFLADVHFSMDPTFVDFLHFARIQPRQLHKNATRIILALIVLCRKFRVEMTPNIVRMYFTPLCHTGLTLSFDEPLTIDEQKFYLK